MMLRLQRAQFGFNPKQLADEIVEILDDLVLGFGDVAVGIEDAHGLTSVSSPGESV